MQAIRKALVENYRSVEGVPFRLTDKEKMRVCFASAGMAVIALIVALVS